MRQLLLGLIGVVLAAPPGAFAQTVSYEVRGKTVRLEVNREHLLVRPQKDVGARQAAEAAVRAQSESLKVSPAPYLKQLAEAPPIAIRQVRGVLVPRVAGLSTDAVGGLADLAKDDLRSSELVYKFGDQVVIPTGTVSVRFKREAGKALAEELKLQELDRPEYAAHVVRLQPVERGADPFRVAARLRERDDVLWAEPDLVYKIGLMGPERLPNDPYFKNQWYLKSIHAPEAWAVSVGSDKITVAVLDDGVDQQHVDLKDEIVKGYDFYEGDDDPQPDQKSAHGTCCAGLIAATADNGVGTAGIAWHARIMPLRISGAEGFAGDDHIAKAFLFAKDNGAKVLSCSWGGGPLTNKLMDAIDTATAAGCLIVVAAGNAVPARPVFFPAAYNKCVAVGALRHDDTRWDYSCFGPGNEVMVVAPSGDCNNRGEIWTTDHSGSNGYNPGNPDFGDREGHFSKRFGGTSAACPIVAGVAALVWSAHPSLTAPQLLQALTASADKVDSENGDYQDGRSKQYGFGKVNALAALKKAAELAGSGRTDDGGAGFTKSLTDPGAPRQGEASKARKRLQAALEPAEELYDVRGQAVKLRPNKAWLAVTVPADPDKGKECLARVVVPDKAGPEAVKEVRKDRERRILLVPREALKSPRDLEAAARGGTLPPVAAVYEADRSLLVPLGTLTCRLAEGSDAARLTRFADKHGLEAVPDGDNFKLRLTEKSGAVTVFEAMRALRKEVPLRWCEPDFVRRIEKFGGE